MENLAHTLTGLALSRCGLGTKVPYGTVSIIVAANLPDIDVAAGFKGPLYYLHYHRGITHSLAGSVVLGIALGLLVWLLRRWSKQRNASLWSSVGICLLSTLTHPLLDWTNSYGLRPYLPFSEARYFGDLVFIVDPYLWLILGSGVFLSARVGKRALYLWFAGVALAGLAGLALSARGPIGLWYLGFLLFFLFVTIWLYRRQVVSPRAALISLIGMSCYWATLGLSHTVAQERAVRQLSDSYAEIGPLELFALPRLADPFTWDVLGQDNEYIFRGHSSSLKRTPLRLKKYPRNLNAPETRVALLSCPGRVLAYFARFDYYQVTDNSDSVTVTFRDARFVRNGGSGFGTYRIRLRSDRRVAEVAEPCPPPPALVNVVPTARLSGDPRP